MFLSALQTSSLRRGFKPGLFTHALDISRLNSHGLDNDVPKDWLCHILAYLPHMRCLIVSKLHFFDHGSLNNQALPYNHAVRLLSAAQCANMTSRSLDILFSRLSELFYLDLSCNPGLDRRSLIPAISVHLEKLQVLKLRRIGLTDFDLLKLMHSLRRRMADMGRGIRSLDLRDNLLTDEAVIALAKHKEEVPTYEYPPPYNTPGLSFGGNHWLTNTDWVRYLESRIRAEEHKDTFTDKESEVMKQLRDPRLVASLDGPRSLQNVITHLYLSGNRFTAPAIVNFLRTFPLRVLDCGSFGMPPVDPEDGDSGNMKRSFGGSTSAGLSPGGYSNDEKVTAAARVALALRHCPTLRYLRATHYVVTGYSAYHDNKESTLAIRNNYSRNDHLRQRSAAASNQTSSARYGNPEQSSMMDDGAQWDREPVHDEVERPFKFSEALASINTLVLTSVPAHSKRGRTTACLQAFLQACGDMERISGEYQWKRNHGDLKPTSGQPLAPFILSTREIRLEVANPMDARSAASSDENVDLEEAIQDDFSFFPEEKSSKKIVRPSAENISGAATESEEMQHPDFDVVSSLAGFRHAQREAQFQNSTISNQDSIWTGKLIVVRNSESD